MNVLNCAMECLDQMLSWRDAARQRRGHEDIAELLGDWCEELEQGHKFLLPPDGFLFDHTPISMARGLRLPFKTTVLEWCLTGTDIRWESTRGADRRITVFKEEAIDGVPGISALDLARGHSWSPAQYGYWVPLDTEPEPVTTPAGADPRAVTWAFSGMGLLQFFEGPPPPNRLFAPLSLSVLAQFCAAMRCKNVYIDREDPPEALQKKRAKKGKRPLFSYHVLKVESHENVIRRGSLGGTHASPRTHTRRGHVRKHPTAGDLWIEEVLVNARADGSVNKDYAVTR